RGLRSEERATREGCASKRPGSERETPHEPAGGAPQGAPQASGRHVMSEAGGYASDLPHGDGDLAAPDDGLRTEQRLGTEDSTEPTRAPHRVIGTPPPAEART